MSTTLSPAFVRFMAIAMATALEREQQRSRLLGGAVPVGVPLAQSQAAARGPEVSLGQVAVRPPEPVYLRDLPTRTTVTAPVAPPAGEQAAVARPPTVAKAMLAPPVTPAIRPPTPSLHAPAPAVDQPTLAAQPSAPAMDPASQTWQAAILAPAPAVDPVSQTWPAADPVPAPTVLPPTAVPLANPAASALFQGPLEPEGMLPDGLEMEWPDLSTQLLAEAHLREALARIIRDDALRHGLTLKE